MNLQDILYQANKRLPGQMKRGYSPMAASMFAATNSTPNTTAERIVSSPGGAILDQIPDKYLKYLNDFIDYGSPSFDPTNIGTYYTNSSANRETLESLMNMLLMYGAGRGYSKAKTFANNFKAVNEYRELGKKMSENVPKPEDILKGHLEFLQEKSKLNKNKLFNKAVRATMDNTLEQFNNIRNAMAEYPEFSPMAHDLQNLISKASGSAAASARKIFNSNYSIDPKANSMVNFRDLVEQANKSRSLNRIGDEFVMPF